jgi:hypothetical protein
MEPERAVSAAWSPAQRIGFRYVFVYLILYNLPFPAGLLWDGDPLSRGYEKLWEALVPWVGRVVLRLPEAITIFPAGSGDTTFNYVQVLCYALLALVATIVWSAHDTKRPSYERLHCWLRVYVRLALGVTMMGYGAVKVIKSQFPSPWLARLVQPYGDSSPMGLLWTFMGYSHTYNVFTGAGETIAGMLLFARRTTTLGALLGVGVLSHIVVLNFPTRCRSSSSHSTCWRWPYSCSRPTSAASSTSSSVAGRSPSRRERTSSPCLAAIARRCTCGQRSS